MCIFHEPHCGHCFDTAAKPHASVTYGYRIASCLVPEFSVVDLELCLFRVASDAGVEWRKS